MIGAGAVGFAAASQFDYTGPVSFGTAIILIALGAVTIYNRHKGDTARMLREQIEDWRKRCEELTTERAEWRAKVDMTTFAHMLETFGEVIRTQASAGHEMQQAVLEQIERHDRRITGSMEQIRELLELISARQLKFRREDEADS